MKKAKEAVTAYVVGPDVVEIGGSRFARLYGNAKLGGCEACGREMPHKARWCPWCGHRAEGDGQ